MKSTLLMMTIACISLSACDTATKQHNNTNETPNQETTMNNEKGTTLTFTYNDGGAQEKVHITLSEDGKKVVSGSLEATGGSTHPITFVDMEYADDLDLFLGGAMSVAWEGEAMVGLEGDLSKFSWDDGKTKKVFNK